MSRTADLSTLVKSLLQKEKTLSEHEVETIHFFRREYSYTCYGFQAIALAEEYYHTSRVLRVDQGMECLDVSRKLLAKIGGSLLERHLRMKVWQKTSPSPTAPWDLKLEATHGNFQALEDEIGKLERDVTSSCFIAAVKADSLDPLKLGLAFVSTITHEIHLYEYEDDHNYSKLESLLLQYGTSICVTFEENCNDQEQGDEKYKTKTTLEKAILKADVQVEYMQIKAKKFNKASTITELLSLVANAKDMNLPTSSNIQVELNNLHYSLMAAFTLLINLSIWGSTEYKGTYQISIDNYEEFMKFDANVSEALQLFPEDLSFGTYQLDSTQSNDVPTSSTGSSAVTKKQMKSLLDILHSTRCSMGSRLLRYWMQHPLCNRESILKRQELINSLKSSVNNLNLLRDSKDYLKGYPDLERVVLRLRSVKSSYPASAVLKDMLDIYKAIHKARSIGVVLSEIASSTETDTEIKRLADNMKSMLERYDRYLCLVEELIDTDHMQAIQQRSRGGGSSSSQSQLLLHRDRFYRVKPSFSQALKDLFQNMMDTEVQIISEYNSIQKATGLDAKELHLEDSEVHGWHMRVTKRISTKTLKSLDTQKLSYEVLSNQKAGTLFVTKKMKQYLIKYINLRDSYQDQQRQIVLQALDVVKTYFSTLLELSKVISTIDVASTLASVALEKDWTVPQFLEEGSERKMEIQEMRHPLLEEQIGSFSIVKNNVHVNSNKFVGIISGPNMGGKSTYMRSIGIIAYLAQIGSFVPATSAVLPVFDKIFIRSGSKDCSLLGISSFMAEMIDAASILHSATSKSLVLIDELGRGTSITDGFGIAWAILEQLAYKNQATTFCATHFHELNLLHDPSSSIDSRIPTTIKSQAVQNPFFCLHVEAQVDEQQDTVSMLYQVHSGPTDSSYGIHVAKAAKFPFSIVNRASEIEKKLESSGENEEQLDGPPSKRLKI